MRPVLAELLSLLRLERVEENLFRGPSQDLGWGAVFGGQVLGQALSAAAQTVPAERIVHSMHAYFLRPGDAKRPIVYEVDRIRDGGSFTTRRVVAIQSGKPIFSMSCSFHVEEPGFDHATEMPDVTPPEELVNEEVLAQRIAERIPEPLRKQLVAERPFEIRLVNPIDPTRPKAGPPSQAVWYRAAGTLPDDPALHRYLLAYASDFHFIGTSLRPHAVGWMTPGMQVTSLDHAMWFHRPFRLDDWVLHIMESPSASGARGMVKGRFYDRQGRLLASTAQEGLIRKRS